MPGIFGGSGCKSEQYAALKSSFNSVWGKCESISFPNGFIGGHAFSKDSALHVTTGGLNFAVDGENSLYKNAAKFAQKGEPSLFHWQDNKPELGVNCKGNVAIWDEGNQTLYLATEWTGSFPLYYTRVNGGLLFSSHLRPLSRIVKATPDPIGLIQFMKYGFILAGRTFFKNIHRLMPGQVLAYQQINHRLMVYETSRAWRDYEGEIDFSELVKYNWMTFKNTMRRCLEFSCRPALFSSSGWDSRLLLAVFRELDETSSLLCYTHGDLKSREINIAKQMYEDMGINYHLEPLDGNMFDLQVLQRGFDRVENVVFPHYHRAGIMLAEAGIDCACAGVLGEVIGGRHGMHWPMLPISEWDKISFVTSHLFRPRRNHTIKNNKDISIFYDFLHLDKINKPWYVRSEFWNTITNIKEEMYSDMEEFVHRLKARGVDNIDKLLEAYTAEYFGAHYLTPQLLSCRSDINVTIPFADQELLELTSRIPLAFKIVHTLQQAILRYYNSELLRYPNAAAFFNSKIPIPVLEVSRVFRKLFESMSWKICRVTNGRYKPTPTGWSTFSCLRNNPALLNIADNLSCDMIDKNEIQNRMKRGLSQIEPQKSMYAWNAAQNQIMKIYTTDLMVK